MKRIRGLDVDEFGATNQTRIAVLEKVAETHERRISDIEDFHRSVVDRLDQKIQLDAANQIAMEKTMAQAVTSLDALSKNLALALEMSAEANKISIKHEAIASSTLKIGGILATVAAGLWALFKFFVGGF